MKFPGDGLALAAGQAGGEAGISTSEVGTIEDQVLANQKMLAMRKLRASLF
jgi:hypothetical protein